MVPLRALGTLMALTLFVDAAYAEPAKQSTEAAKPMATVVTVDGKGIAKLRRKAGTETTVVALQELQVGDKITTDDKAVVQLSLPDGTLVRIGINSEYRIESARVDGSFTAWVFNLARGSIRALVEKSSPRKEAKFRVNTPSGTMGVRGTEFLLEHNVKTNVTTLYTFEGKVSFGALDCEEKTTCIEVKAGEVSSIGKGARAPEPVKGVKLDEMAKATSMELKAAVGDKGEGALSSAEAAAAAARLSVLAPLGELGKDPTLLDDTALMKAAKEAGQELADLQDVLANRDKPTRAAMEQAARDGTLEDRLALGKAVTNDGTEKEPLNKANAVTRFKAAAKYEAEKAAEEKSGKKQENASANKILSKIKAQEAKTAAKASSILKNNGAQVKRSNIDLAATIQAAQSKLAETVKARNAALAAGNQDHASKLADQANDLVKQINEHESQQQKEYEEMQKGELVESETKSQTATSTETATSTTSSTGTGTGTGTKTKTPTGCGKMAEDAVCTASPTCDSKYVKCGYEKEAWTAWCKECNKDKSLYYKRKANDTPANARVGGGLIGAIVDAISDAIQDQRPSNFAPPRTCYTTKRVCETKMIPCSLLSGKKCTPKYEEKCRDKQVEIECR